MVTVDGNRYEVTDEHGRRWITRAPSKADAAANGANALGVDVCQLRSVSERSERPIARLLYNGVEVASFRDVHCTRDNGSLRIKAGRSGRGR